MQVKLGVNIDHVATLRQARRAQVPVPEDAADVCLHSGAEYIVVHLRKDERHIHKKDVAQLFHLFPGKIHLECSSSAAMEKAALTYKPFSVCIVPEKPGEITTTGGLRFSAAVNKRLQTMIERLHRKNILVSLYISPSGTDVRTAARLGADIVELCTRDYSEVTSRAAQQKELKKLVRATQQAQKLGLEVHAGHGLDYQNVQAVARIKGMACMNIGFSILARALFTGMSGAVRAMKDLL